MAPATTSVSSGGVTLTVEAEGPSDGPLVVLMHGGGQTRHSWRGMRSLLAETGYRVLNYDARGHGDSDWPASGDYSYEALADDLVAVVAREGGRPAALVGASLGGLTSIAAVTRQPPLPCWALVLVDIVPRVNHVGKDRVLEFMSAYPDGFASVEEAFAATRAYAPGRKKDSSVAGLERNLRKRGDRFYWHWDPAFLTSRVDDTGLPPVENILREASFPIVLVRGAISDVVTEAEADHFLATVPNAELRTIANVGHMVTGDKNDAFAVAIKTFLDDAVASATAAG